jgi:hypothetical protein
MKSDGKLHHERYFSPDPEAARALILKLQAEATNPAASVTNLLPGTVH